MRKHEIAVVDRFVQPAEISMGLVLLQGWEYNLKFGDFLAQIALTRLRQHKCCRTATHLLLTTSGKASSSTQKANGKTARNGAPTASGPATPPRPAAGELQGSQALPPFHPAAVPGTVDCTPSPQGLHHPRTSPPPPSPMSVDEDAGLATIGIRWSQQSSHHCMSKRTRKRRCSTPCKNALAQKDVLQKER